MLTRSVESANCVGQGLKLTLNKSSPNYVVFFFHFSKARRRALVIHNGLKHLIFSVLQHSGISPLQDPWPSLSLRIFHRVLLQHCQSDIAGVGRRKRYLWVVQGPPLPLRPLSDLSLDFVMHVQVLLLLSVALEASKLLCAMFSTSFEHCFPLFLLSTKFAKRLPAGFRSCFSACVTVRWH